MPITQAHGVHVGHDEHAYIARDARFTRITQAHGAHVGHDGHAGIARDGRSTRITESVTLQRALYSYVP
jgi:hypothetical protein